MDIVSQVLGGWNSTVAGLPLSIQTLSIRVATGLLVAFVLSKIFFSSITESTADSSIFLRVTFSIIGIATTLFLPVEFLASNLDRTEITVLFTISMLLLLMIPSFLAKVLARTLGRQILLRKWIYMSIALLFLFQIGIEGGR